MEHTLSVLEMYNHLRMDSQREARRIMRATRGKAVHHIDGNRFNNDPGNLVLVDMKRDS